MPELPEVETVKKTLIKSINGKDILKSKLIVKKALRTSSPISVLDKQKIVDIHRKGKQLVVETTNVYVALHLRMEGKFFYYKEKPKDIKHTILFLELNEGYLLFNDHRKFATIDIYNKLDYSKWYDVPEISKLGAEPWDINVNEFYNILQSKRTNIKATLLDQKIISGLGNIYVNEVLYLSSVSPHRKSNTLTRKEAELIINHSIEVLKESIKLGGTTIRSYESAKGISGNNQNTLKVHTKKKCPKGHDIIFEKVGGRGTFWCSSCQK